MGKEAGASQPAAIRCPTVIPAEAERNETAARTNVRVNSLSELDVCDSIVPTLLLCGVCNRQTVSKARTKFRSLLGGGTSYKPVSYGVKSLGKRGPLMTRFCEPLCRTMLSQLG